ncbi:probable NADH dehydrogenase [ubiquinone] 1 alpha subcomplex subunit 12 [Diaphorina citri]|uniref:NADH dehydrogenase [ubiquinone] 1 alpha subcomplex subunit 12 n=1 Tax=Diaphorina citri TaxID=121845 RepID=A0A1S3DBQ4_DIACI|nr:probable NADH dehydrogenase [ubiquinone] 1 alpha subcomplex subunit 12 [Diaphorina citri]KAI5741441.1 hypothetical protein M8J76_013634 [Diaphorina citri]KAI5747073.1 hypothetical protein M8J77_010752 [Diaphorina citri]
MSKLKNFLGINVLENLRKIYKENGGLKNCWKTLYLTDDLKFGKYVGIDQFGNKYYENPRYFFGRNRWVIYNPDVGLNYDGSMVPAEWYGWLHYKTDYTPCEDPGRPVYKWMAEHTQNMSGSNKEYVPYSTTRDKIQAWTPPSSSGRNKF